MAEDQHQEKSHQATPKRQADARKKGQIPRSRDLNTALIVISAGLFLLVLGKPITHQLGELMQDAFSLAGEKHLETASIAQFGLHVLATLAFSILPLLLALFFVSLLTPMLLGGVTFNFTLLQPKGERISIIKGIKRIFSSRNVMELVKSILKFFVLLGLGILIIKHALVTIIHFSQLDNDTAIKGALTTLHWLLIMISSGLILFAVIDVPYQIWEHQRKLKMSTQEIKEETKSTEGSPETKQRIRKQQQALANQRMIAEIPSANVIITNPDHYAVALKYDDKQGGAPILVAKGVDYMAERIKQIGGLNNVPIIESPPLARSLYYNTKLFQEIPAGLYQAVAKVLAYLHNLRRYHAGLGLKPILEDELPIPDALKRDPETVV